MQEGAPRRHACTPCILHKGMPHAGVILAPMQPSGWAPLAHCLFLALPRPTRPHAGPKACWTHDAELFYLRYRQATRVLRVLQAAMVGVDLGSTGPIMYIMQPGDTLAWVAQAAGLRVEQVCVCLPACACVHRPQGHMLVKCVRLLGPCMLPLSFPPVLLSALCRATRRLKPQAKALHAASAGLYHARLHAACCLCPPAPARRDRSWRPTRSCHARRTTSRTTASRCRCRTCCRACA